MADIILEKKARRLKQMAEAEILDPAIFKLAEELLLDLAKSLRKIVSAVGDASRKISEAAREVEKNKSKDALESQAKNLVKRAIPPTYPSQSNG